MLTPESAAKLNARVEGVAGKVVMRIVDRIVKGWGSTTLRMAENNDRIQIIMETKVLNYRIIIESDTRTGTNEPGYAAYCPTLGLADGGDTIEEAVENIKKLIVFHIECLVKERESVPFDSEEEMLLTAKVRVRVDQGFSFA